MERGGNKMPKLKNCFSPQRRKGRRDYMSKKQNPLLSNQMHSSFFAG
jgi:hypothetical protein